MASCTCTVGAIVGLEEHRAAARASDCRRYHTTGFDSSLLIDIWGNKVLDIFLATRSGGCNGRRPLAGLNVRNSKLRIY